MKKIARRTNICVRIYKKKITYIILFLRSLMIDLSDEL